MGLGPSYKLPKIHGLLSQLHSNKNKNKNKDKAEIYLFKRTRFGGQVMEWKGVRHPFRTDKVWSSHALDFKSHYFDHKD